MSANLLVDLYSTCLMQPTLTESPILSGSLLAPCSGALIGNGVNMINANTVTNLFVCGAATSGQLRVAVQCAAADVSGQYTDPTSGLAQLPGAFSSGGILIINSGGLGGGTLGPTTSGQVISGGFMVSSIFQRTGQFARAILLSGDFGVCSLVGFISNLKVTGSGGGTSQLPQSGTPSV